MGIYSELILGVELVSETPEEVITIIKFLCREDGYYPLPENVTYPDHPFFRTERSERIFSNAPASFDSIPGSSLIFDKYTKGYILTVRAHLKNYEMEYEYFLDWIAPYCQTGKEKLLFVGYILLEIFYSPILVYCFRGQFWLAGIIDFSEEENYDEDGILLEVFGPDNPFSQLKVEPFISLKDYIKKRNGNQE